MRVTPAPSGSELESGDKAGNTIQLRIPIGMAASAQIPRILASEYCPSITVDVFARELFSIFSSYKSRQPANYSIQQCILENYIIITKSIHYILFSPG